MYTMQIDQFFKDGTVVLGPFDGVTDPSLLLAVAEVVSNGQVSENTFYALNPGMSFTCDIDINKFKDKELLEKVQLSITAS